MHVECIDILRCTRAHEAVPLVAVAVRTEGRHLLEGTLGCPACGAEYPVSHGAVSFGGSELLLMVAPEAFDEERGVRLAALLGFDERGGLYVLDQLRSIFAEGFAERFPGTRFAIIGPPCDDEDAHADLVLRGVDEAIPLADGCARGVALDRGAAELLRAAVRVLAPGGRLVAHARTRVPDGIDVLARDDLEWVGVKSADAIAPTLVTPRRAAPRTGNR